MPIMKRKSFSLLSARGFGCCDGDSSSLSSGGFKVEFVKNMTFPLRCWRDGPDQESQCQIVAANGGFAD